jgi:hypothetical protein
VISAIACRRRNTGNCAYHGNVTSNFEQKKRKNKIKIMKKLNLLFTLLISIIVISSCSKSEDNPISSIPTNSGKLIVNGVEKTLTKGFIIPNYNGTDVNYNKRRFYFILTNDEVTLQNNNFIYSNNIKQLIDFNMYCSSLNPGSIQYTTYNVKNSHTNVNYNDPFIDHSGINTNVVIQNGVFVSGNSLNSDDMTVGQTSISNNNGIYTINFSFSNAQNNITGTYTGTLTNLNYQY